MIEIKGYTDDKFKSIRNIFLDNFRKRGEIGASFCVYYNNKLVIDIWGGHKDLAKNKAWDKDTIVPLFSTSKVIAASCLAICHSRGLFDYQDKVAQYWPAFAQNGKENISIEQLLQHRAGLAVIDTKLTPTIIADTKLLDKILAKQKPYFKTNDYQAYHVWTIGWYISALLSRIDPKGRRVKQFIEDEILPNIEGEIRIGINKDYNIDNVATLKPFSKIQGMQSLPFELVKEFFKPWSHTYKAMLNPIFLGNHSNLNKREVLELEIPSANGISNAKALASLFNALNHPKNTLFLGEETLNILSEYPNPPKFGFKDKTLMQDAFCFHKGFMKPSSQHSFSPNKEAIGGFGAGGSFVLFDPIKEITMAYTMNKMGQEIMNMEREVKIREAVYEIIGN